jgi:ankyrin repeat protein
MALSMRRMQTMMALLAALAAATPAAAQFSDAYNFVKAVKDKDGAKATELLNKPGSSTLVNAKDGETGDAAIHITVRRADAPWMALVLRAGGNPNLRDGQGNTPIMIATQIRWVDGMRLLLDFGVQVNAQNRLGETALLKAVQARDLDSVKLLLEGRANPDIADNSGLSARAVAERDPRATQIARLFKDIPVKKPQAMQGPSL